MLWLLKGRQVGCAVGVNSSILIRDTCILNFYQTPHSTSPKKFTGLVVACVRTEIWTPSVQYHAQLLTCTSDWRQGAYMSRSWLFISGRLVLGYTATHSLTIFRWPKARWQRSAHTQFSKAKRDLTIVSTSVSHGIQRRRIDLLLSHFYHLVNSLFRIFLRKTEWNSGHSHSH